MNPAAWALRTRLWVAAASGVALMAAFPPVGQGYMAPIALVPLMLALRGARGRTGALVGGVFAATFFPLLLAWISMFGFLALAVLTLGHVAYFAVFGAVAARAGQRWGSAARILGWPVLWASLEMMRGRWPLGGLTWGDIGYSQIAGSTMLPLARVGGVFVLSAAIVAVAVLVAEIVGAPPRARTGLATGALAIVLVPGFAPLGLAGPQTDSYDVAAVQGNVPREAFSGFGRGRGPAEADIVGNHIDVTRRLLAEQVRPDLVVWPENAFDRDPRLYPHLFEPVQRLVGELGTPLIMPAILDGEQGFANANLLVDPAGRIVQRYDKVHLVPFGEYVPWDWVRSIVPALDAEIPVNGIPGTALAPFDVSGARIGTLICFESTYPALARTLVNQGSELLVVTTNNASFQTSPAAEQHLAMSRMRAVEHGKALVHAAISGISAIVAPDGTVEQRTELFEPALLRAELPLTTGRTPYARYGAGVEIAMGIGALAVAALAVVRRREDHA